MTEVTRIIAAVVDTRQLTLYREDGTSILIPQGDPRIRALADKVIIALEEQKYCDLSVEELALTNHYNAAQDSTNGFVQFFRTFKTTMESLLSQFAALDQAQVAPVAPTSAGEIPIAVSASQAAVAEIMANAVPVTSPAFHEPLTKEETVVAVVDNAALIPGVEKLDLQLQAVAGKLGSPEGITNFFRRLATVQRNHSVEDLLTFMEKGELPLADDGSVLVYKRLKSTQEEGVFVDCHTGKVKQRVGSHVFMDEALVDPNRHQECSNGLHVARRDYLHSFNGSITVLAKLAPEDVIAVPHQDARKLRAKGYHIIAQLSQEDARLVCDNKPMQDTVLLGNAIKGNHVGVLETVEICGHHGSKVKITAMKPSMEPVALEEDLQASSLDHLPQQLAENTKVDAAQVAKKVIQRKQAKDQAQALMERMLLANTQAEQVQAAKELLAFKKASKKGWAKLGLTEQEGVHVVEIAQGTPAKKTQPTPAKPATKAKPANWKPVNPTPRERIRELLDKGLTSVGVAQAIVTIKKQAKKSWEALGVSSVEQDQILKLVNK